MSNRIIRDAYESRIKTWASSHALPVAYQKITFDPKGVPLYLQAILMPARTIALNHSYRRLYSGMYQMNLVSTDGGGTKTIEDLQVELEELFVMGELENLVMVSAPLATSPGFNNSTNYVLPSYSTYRLIK